MPETKPIDPKMQYLDAQTAQANAFGYVYKLVETLQAENTELKARIAELETRKE